MEPENIYEINHYTMGGKVRWLRIHRTKDNSIKGYMSSDVLAKELNISPSTLNKVENGKDCNLSTIFAIADYFHVSIDWLCSRSKVRNTDYDLNYVCDYTGLSEEAISALKKRHEDTDFIKHEAIPLTHYVEEEKILNEIFVSGLAYKIAFNTAEYKEAITKGTREYSTLIQNLEDSKSIEDHLNWIIKYGTTDIEKELIYNLFYSQEEVKNFMKDYAKEERQALEDKRNQYKELSKKKGEGAPDGNNQKTR